LPVFVGSTGNPDLANFEVAGILNLVVLLFEIRVTERFFQNVCNEDHPAVSAKTGSSKTMPI